MQPLLSGAILLLTNWLEDLRENNKSLERHEKSLSYLKNCFPRNKIFQEVMIENQQLYLAVNDEVLDDHKVKKLIEQARDNPNKKEAIFQRLLLEEKWLFRAPLLPSELVDKIGELYLKT